MRKTTLILALFLFSYAGALVNSTLSWAKEIRTALVIGNANYEYSALRNPVNDAKDMANALGRLGFLVTLKTNVTQKSMEQSIRDFGKNLGSGGVGLFYYAGHAIQFRGQNYLIPINSNIETEADVKYEAVDAGRVLSQMEEAGNSLNIIILDACRNNPFLRSFRSTNQGLARMDAPTGSILAFSTAPGSVAADGAGMNGLYTSVLLKHIATPGIELNHLFMRVRNDVIKLTNKKQVPWESSSLTGHFYFNPSSKTMANEQSTQTSSYADTVLNHFQIISKKAEAGDPDAQVALAEYYIDEYDGKENLEQMYNIFFYWIRKAALQGNAKAQTYLGAAYDLGTGVEQSYDNASKWYKKAALQGNSEAQYYLAELYCNGSGVPKDNLMCYAYLKLSAEKEEKELSTKKLKDLDKILNDDQKASAASLYIELKNNIENK